MSAAVTLDFNGESRTVTVDAGVKTLARLRRVLIGQVGAGLDQSATAWSFVVDGAPVSLFDAANRPVRDGMHVSLSLRKAVVPSRKRTRPTATEKRQDDALVRKMVATTAATGADFNLAARLVRLLRENRSVLESDRATNGMVAQHIFHVLGHIRARLAPSYTSYRVLTEPSADPLSALRAASANVAVGPLFVPGHVSLLCVYGGQRVLHLDASGGAGSVVSDSRTHVNYQQFDDTNAVQGLAGGNCGSFTVLFALQCVVRAGDYASLSVPFDAFWDKFTRVLLTNSGVEPEKGRRMLYETARRFAPDIPLALVAAPDTLRDAAQWTGALLRALVADGMDFVADAIVLDMFVELSLGFHQVALLGNVFRRYMRDFTERGLLSAPLIGGGIIAINPSGTPVLAARILTGAREPSPEDVEAIVTDLLDIDPDYDGDALDRLEARPKQLADVFLRAYLHVDESNLETGRILAMKYLRSRDDATAAAAEEAARTLRDERRAEAQARAYDTLPMPGVLVDDVFPAAARFQLVLDPQLPDMSVRVHASYLTRLLSTDANRRFVQIRASGTGGGVIVYALPAYATPESENIAVVYASAAVLLALGPLELVQLRAYVDIPLATLVTLASERASDTLEQHQDAIRAQLNGTPVLSVGQALHLPGGDGVTFVVTRLDIEGGSSVFSAAMPPIEKGVAFAAASQCVVCGNDPVGTCCAVPYCSRTCQARDVGHVAECLSRLKL